MSGSSKLYPGEIVIDADKIWQHGDPESFVETMTPIGMSTGLSLERRRTPFGAMEKAPAFSLPQIPSSEYQARIKEMEELGSSISQRMVRAGIPSKDQQSTNFCWIFSTVSAYECRRMLQGETYINFSPASCGGILTNGRNVGGWCEQAIKGIDQYGLAPDSMWDSTQISGRRSADLLKKMKTFDVPSFAEVTPNSLPDLMTAGLSYTPLAVGLNWWGHAILFCEPVWLDGAVAYRFRNSWGASYGSNGFGILQGRKMIPDDCVAVLSVSPADVGDMG